MPVNWNDRIAVDSAAKREGAYWTEKICDENDCLGLSQQSLKCLERNQEHRSRCQPYFDAYKECKKKQTEERKKKNFEASGGSLW